ncbi:MAG: glycosyltransferase [Ktedonobacteraceae bacterium]|nr:glycosyltransferase [Ktedonobacteraceae bacterium]
MTTRPYRTSIPPEILALSHERDLLRRRGQYQRADELKKLIENAGYAVKDNPHGAHLITLPGVDVDGKTYRMARNLPSLLDEADTCAFSVIILAHNNAERVRRCIESVLRFADVSDIELLLVDNASQDGIDLWVEALKYQEPRLHLLRATRTMGVAEAYNMALKQSRGRYILLLDSSAELTGDIFTPLEKTLANREVGITGFHGLRTEDLRHFIECEQDEAEVIDSQCMAFRRNLLKKTGLFDERYRYPHFMDIDFNFAIRDAGAEVVVTPDLPITYHAGEQNEEISDAERTRLAKRNFYRFLEKWGDREDLLPYEDEEVEDEE